MTNNLLSAVNDVFILSTSGVPYYSTCFGGEICKRKPDHLLQAGFIVAMFSFAKEFGLRSIIHVEFQDALMVYGVREIQGKEILTVLFTSKDVDINEVKNLTSKTADIFIENFREKLTSESDIINVDDYKSFSDYLLGLEIVKNQPVGDLSQIIIDRKKKQKKNAALLFNN